MTKREAGNERQVAYTKVLDAIRNHEGQMTKAAILLVICDVANRDIDWMITEAPKALLAASP